MFKQRHFNKLVELLNKAREETKGTTNPLGRTDY